MFLSVYTACSDVTICLQLRLHILCILYFLLFHDTQHCGLTMTLLETLKWDCVGLAVSLRERLLGLFIISQITYN